MRCTHWRQAPLDLVREARDRSAVDASKGPCSAASTGPAGRGLGGSGANSSGKTCGTCNGLGEIHRRAGRRGARVLSRSMIRKEGH